jgi:hypothetical protein
MNFFLVLVILALLGGGYMMYTQDQQKLSDLQQQVDDANAKIKASDTPASAATNPPPAVTSKPPTVIAQPMQPAVTVAPDISRSSAIDAAAATAVSNSRGVGTIKTLDGHTYTNCKVLKVEQDGVTFSHDDGITKILYPLMPPNVQKMFDYNPQKAVQQTDAQIRYDQQQAALSNQAPAAPAAPTNQ